MTKTGSISPTEPTFGALIDQRLQGRRFNNQAEGAGELLDAVTDLLREWRTKLPGKEEILTAVGNAYDTFIAPIDIRMVPNIIEPMVDAMLRKYLLSAVDALYDRLLGE